MAQVFRHHKFHPILEAPDQSSRIVRSRRDVFFPLPPKLMSYLLVKDALLCMIVYSFHKVSVNPKTRYKCFQGENPKFFSALVSSFIIVF